MKKSRLATLLVVGVIVVAAAALMTMRSAAQESPVPRSDGLQPYMGDGWWFLYPANATLETVSDTEVRVMGPDISIRPADMDFMVSGPAYQISVTVFDNPERVFPEVWAQNKILADWQAAMAEGAPNTFPVTDDGQLDPDKFSVLIVGNRPAVQAEFFGGDAALMHVYIGSGDKIIMFVYRAEMLPNNPLAVMQVDVYNLIMSTVGFMED